MGKLPKRVLVQGMTENLGGIESCILNYYQNVDRERVQFDFLCNFEGKVAYEEELLALGARVFRVTPRSKNPIKFRKELKQLYEIHNKEWCAVWVNVCILANIDYLILAKKYGIKKRIIHSHNSGDMDNSYQKRIQHLVNKRRIKRFATDFWACSRVAAEWFYEGDVLKRAIIINNAIDIDRYSYSHEKRKETRNNLGLDEDTYLIGNIGRLQFQKNQSFALDVFDTYSEYNQNAFLVFVGKGEDEEKLKARSKKLGISDRVYFAGIRKDIDAWLSAFDLFLFPSVFEGLSVVALEAQANGVPILASEEVSPNELRINDNYNSLSLRSTADEWAREIDVIKTNEKRTEGKNIQEGFLKAGFVIEKEAKKLEYFLVEDKC